MDNEMATDQLYRVLERIEAKLDHALERIDRLEADKDKRAGAKATIMGIAGLIAGSGLLAWISELLTR